MPKIVVTDTDFEDNNIEIEMAKEAGVKLALFNDRSADAIIRNAADADGVVTSYGDYSARVFEALPHLKVVLAMTISMPRRQLKMVRQCVSYLVMELKWCPITLLRLRLRVCVALTNVMLICALACGITLVAGLLVRCMGVCLA